jgi:putative transposase
VVPTQVGPADEQLATAEAIAEALDPALVSRLAAQARAQGVQLLGRGGVLQQLTKRFLEAALEAEMDVHLGYDKHDRAGRNGGNARNGRRAKTLLTEVGPVDAAVPRDRDGTFNLATAPKRSRRLGGVEGPDGVAVGQGPHPRRDLRPPGRGVRSGGVQRPDHPITDRVMDGMTEWQNRPLDPGPCQKPLQAL